MNIQLSQFDGPFDLLLQLIDSKELTITEVSLSTVTEQFLTYLESIEEERPEEVADFLTVAARLLLLKSSQLIPQFAEIEEEGPSLQDQLALYEAFVTASKDIRDMWSEYKRSVFRSEPPRKSETFVWPEHVDPAVLEQTMLQLVHRNAPPKPLPQTTIDHTVSLKETIKHLQHAISGKQNTHFWEHVDRHNKTSVIVGFLALLELSKVHGVHTSQDAPFTDIAITNT